MVTKRRGFTLVEIMVVVFIIALLLGIAVPQWNRSRERTRRISCLTNLKSIDDAKSVIAIQEHLKNGDEVSEEELVPAFLKGNSFPDCPSGGDYTIQPIGEEPECSVHGVTGGLSGE